MSVLPVWLAGSVFNSQHSLLIHPVRRFIPTRHDAMLCYAHAMPCSPFARYKYFLPLSHSTSPTTLLYHVRVRGPSLPCTAGRLSRKKKNDPLLLGRGALSAVCMHACMVRRGEIGREPPTPGPMGWGYVSISGFIFLLFFLLHCIHWPCSGCDV